LDYVTKDPVISHFVGDICIAILMCPNLVQPLDTASSNGQTVASLINGNDVGYNTMTQAYRAR
ncbi:hypothetical protein DERP_004877, partial [Dermatophagoides pteronyssinus]